MGKSPARTPNRRLVVNPHYASKNTIKFNRYITIARRLIIDNWVIQHTEGMYYLGFRFGNFEASFKNEADALIFRMAFPNG